jgi:hypothetical protein
MDEDAREGGSPVSAQDERTAEDIRADIERTRAEVGDTVEALAEKTDVKGQAQQKVADVKGQAQQRVSDIKGRVDRKREDLMAKARSTTPQSAQEGGQQVVAKAKENPTPLIVAGAALLAFLIGRRTGRP